MFKLVKNTDLTSLLFVMLKLVMKTAGRPPKKSSKRGASMVGWLMAFEMEIRNPNSEILCIRIEIHRIHT